MGKINLDDYKGETDPNVEARLTFTTPRKVAPIDDPTLTGKDASYRDWARHIQGKKPLARPTPVTFSRTENYQRMVKDQYQNLKGVLESADFVQRNLNESIHDLFNIPTTLVNTALDLSFIPRETKSGDYILRFPELDVRGFMDTLMMSDKFAKRGTYFVDREAPGKVTALLGAGARLAGGEVLGSSILLGLPTLLKSLAGIKGATKAVGKTEKIKISPSAERMAQNKIPLLMRMFPEKFKGWTEGVLSKGFGTRKIYIPSYKMGQTRRWQGKGVVTGEKYKRLDAIRDSIADIAEIDRARFWLAMTRNSAFGFLSGSAMEQAKQEGYGPEGQLIAGFVVPFIPSMWFVGQRGLMDWATFGATRAARYGNWATEKSKRMLKRKYANDIVDNPEINKSIDEADKVMEAVKKIDPEIRFTTAQKSRNPALTIEQQALERNLPNLEIVAKQKEYNNMLDRVDRLIRHYGDNFKTGTHALYKVLYQDYERIVDPTDPESPISRKREQVIRETRRGMKLKDSTPWQKKLDRGDELREAYFKLRDKRKIELDAYAEKQGLKLKTISLSTKNSDLFDNVKEIASYLNKTRVGSLSRKFGGDFTKKLIEKDYLKVFSEKGPIFFHQLVDFRDSLTAHMSVTKDGEVFKTIASMRSALDDIVTNSFSSLGEKYRDFNKLYHEEYLNVYDRGLGRKIGAKGKQALGEDFFVIPAEDIVGEFIFRQEGKARITGATQFKRIFGNKYNDIVQDAILDDIWKNVYRGSGEMKGIPDPDKWDIWKKDNKDALQILEVDPDKLLYNDIQLSYALQERLRKITARQDVINSQEFFRATKALHSTEPKSSAAFVRKFLSNKEFAHQVMKKLKPVKGASALDSLRKMVFNNIFQLDSGVAKDAVKMIEFFNTKSNYEVLSGNKYVSVGKGRTKLITDPKLRTPLGKPLFTKEHLENINIALTVSDMATSVLPPNIEGPQGGNRGLIIQTLESLTGMKFESIVNKGWTFQSRVVPRRYVLSYFYSNIRKTMGKSQWESVMRDFIYNEDSAKLFAEMSNVLSPTNERLTRFYQLRAYWVRHGFITAQEATNMDPSKIIDDTNSRYLKEVFDNQEAKDKYIKDQKKAFNKMYGR